MSSNLVPRSVGGQVDLTFRDFKADRALGRASLYADVANVAAEKICGLYGKSPSTLVRVVPLGDGFIDNSKGIFDDLCEDIAPPPPLPQPPYSGGQCEAVGYEVRVFYQEAYNFNNEIREREQVVSEQLWGKIGAITIAGAQTCVNGSQSRSGAARIDVVCHGGYFASYAGVQLYPLAGTLGNARCILGINSIQLTRLGGGADNCGNPPSTYPPPSATVDDLNGTGLITIAPNTTVSVPVTIIPTFAPVTGIFRPEFNVDVGGINVNISAGGFTFSPTLEISPNDPYPYSDPRTNPPSPLPISPGGSPDCPDVDIQPVLDRLDEIQDEIEECCDRFFPFQDVPLDKYSVTVLGQANSGDYDLPPFAYRVLVQVIDPGNVKRSQAGINAPDVLYAGWGWFDLGGGMGERMPIDSAFKAFEVPQRSDARFAFTMQGNTVAKVSVFYYTGTE